MCCVMCVMCVMCATLSLVLNFALVGEMTETAQLGLERGSWLITKSVCVY